ncbi:MAG TPA: chemotaxis protein CheB [Gemmatimonadaceae bacterium]|nr:chemotaxis protein CheB [Gemmatimonadaceae bacterium]
MAKKDIVVVGASAGGIEALTELVTKLPRNFPGSIFVVVHVPEGATSVLPKILSRHGALPATHPKNGDRIEKGRLYVAPPNSHMMLEKNRIRLVRGPREHGVRPAVDPLFRSAAVSFGPRVVGVVLSGNLDDGTAGLETIKARGGTSLVQDPDEAQYRGMVDSAIRNRCADEILSAAGIAARLTELSKDGAEAPEAAMAESEERAEEEEKEVAIDELDFAQLHGDDQPGVVSAFVCPDCSGTLWELTNSETLRFRCRVGHAFAVDSLLARQQDAIENAFWVALRALEERGALMRKLVRRAEQSGHKAGIRRYNEEANALADRAKTIRDIILSGILSNGADTPGP